MQIHAPTAFAIACLLAFGLGCVQLALWRRNRAQRALAIVGAAYLAGAVGAVLLSLRGEIPYRISVDIANALVLGGFGLLWHGMRQFEQRPPRLAHTFAGAGLWLIACQVPAFHETFAARVTFMSAAIAAYSVAAAAELWRGGVSLGLPSRTPLAALLLINGVLYAARAPIALLAPKEEPGLSLPANSAWFSLIAVVAIVTIVGISLLLVALAKEQAERNSVHAMAAARDAADQANAEKSRFLARMSHELRTLLNSVLGMAQLLARDTGLDAARREQAATLERAGRHLVAIVNDVLDLGRVEAGRLELAPRPTELRPLLEETLDLARPAAAAKDITLDLHVAPPVPAFVMADALRVRQILLNLIGNAVKFTPRGGGVALACRLGPDGLHLMVTDTGPGIPEEQRERLFQDYERMGADAAGTEGTGLGLAITAALARAMGGAVSYAPGPDGRGSCFNAVLPLPPADPPAPGVPDAPPFAVRQSGLHILVVDDIAANRMVAQALLVQAGHRVETCAEGAAAVAAIARGPVPDAVLMDVFMPGMDGFATTASIRALPGPAGRVPVVAVTAEAAPNEVQACLDAGMDGHVAKPVERDKLLDAISEAIRARA